MIHMTLKHFFVICISYDLHVYLFRLLLAAARTDRPDSSEVKHRPGVTEAEISITYMYQMHVDSDWNVPQLQNILGGKEQSDCTLHDR
jgi:hypothetical protein